MDRLKLTHLRWLAGFWLLVLVGSLLAACGDATTASPATNPATTSAATNSAATTASGTTAAAARPEAKPQVGFTAPDIRVKDINGQALNLADYRGKVVLLNFWGVY